MAKNRRHRQILEADRTDADSVRRQREELVKQIRDYHYSKGPGCGMPYFWQTIHAFRHRTSEEDIMDILAHRVDGDLFGDPKGVPSHPFSDERD